MTCDDVLDVVDLLASGELRSNEATDAHLAGCPSCSSALAAARRLETALRERPVAAPPAQFTAKTMARIRRARWRNEQMIDWGFNAVLVAAALAIAIGIWFVASQAGFALAGSDARELLAASMRSVVQRVTPSLPLYALATALLATALGIWWWAERSGQLFDR
jgi:anti-sigma factor RsiW